MCVSCLNIQLDLINGIHKIHSESMEELDCNEDCDCFHRTNFDLLLEISDDLKVLCLAKIKRSQSSSFEKIKICLFENILTQKIKTKISDAVHSIDEQKETMTDGLYLSVMGNFKILSDMIDQIEQAEQNE